MHRWEFLLVSLCLITVCECALEPDQEKKQGADGKKSPKIPISVAESMRISQQKFLDPEVQKIRRNYWKKTFDDIRDLATASKSTGGRDLLSQWKLYLEDPSDSSSRSANQTQRIATGSRRRVARFEGFPSWDRLLQDWTEDVQDYLREAQENSEEGYSLGNFGRPSVYTNATGEKKEMRSPNIPDDVPFPVPEMANTTTDSLAETESKPMKTSLPVPKPAIPGEPVLPHTDISDLSKRLLVVTTATLPWKTGTAVNPLLRAAYLTKGRKEAGGSVTLMLPWLERQVDQVRVYGKDNVFSSPEDQEQLIRNWLRDSAKLQGASEDLIIQWYTAWQNPAENSIYSMGDIIALIPAESIDICILDEPEHLNCKLCVDASDLT